MNDTPSGMKINFDEQNMTEWEILMDGPEQSLYAVSARRRVPKLYLGAADHTPLRAATLSFD